MMKEGHDDDPPAVCFEDSSRRDVGEVRTLTGGLDLSIAAAVLVDAHLVTVEVDVEQSDVELLSSTRAVAMAKRREDRQRAVDSRVYITNCRQRNVGRAAGLADHGGDTGVSLGDEIVTRQLCQRALLSQRRDRTQDDVGSEHSQPLVPE